MVYISNGVLFIHKEEWNLVIYSKTYGTVGHHVNQNQSEMERQVSHIFSHM
jgi:hypothetical protein